MAGNHNLTMEIIEPTSPEAVQYNSEEGKITLKMKRGLKSTLTLKVKNDNPKDEQAKDDAGTKMGLVIKSVEFLRMDHNFVLTGEKGSSVSHCKLIGKIRLIKCGMGNNSYE